MSAPPHIIWLHWVWEIHRKTVWKYPASSTSAPFILSVLCKAGSPQGQPISDYPTWLAALSVAMGEWVSMTSSLIGGDLSSEARSEVAGDQRREMLAYDWFMSDSLTQPGRQSRRKKQGVKVPLRCIALVALAMVIGFASFRISMIMIWLYAAAAVDSCGWNMWRSFVTTYKQMRYTFIIKFYYIIY